MYFESVICICKGLLLKRIGQLEGLCEPTNVDNRGKCLNQQSVTFQGDFSTIVEARILKKRAATSRLRQQMTQHFIMCHA
jgi:hypothetical protein